MATNKKDGYTLVQLHLTSDELAIVDALAVSQVRSRKSQLTYLILTSLYNSDGPFDRDKGPNVEK